MPAPDPRTHVWRGDLAAESLRGIIDAPAFAKPRAFEIAVDVAPLYAAPDKASERVSEALLGEPISVYETNGDWSWVQIGTDDYVGYLKTGTLRAPGPEATHKLAALRSYLFAAPDLKSSPIGLPSLESRLAVADETGGFFRLESGAFVWGRHVAPLDVFEPDPVAVATRFLGSPYLWGGRTSLGLDCSALVQLSLAACGINCPRDSDMQMALGAPVDPEIVSQGGLQRGDLVFWKGHVGFASDAATLLHANAHHMAVVAEPIGEAVRRIGAAGLEVLAVRRFGPS